MRPVPLLVVASLTAVIAGCGAPPTGLEALVQSGELDAAEAYELARTQVAEDLAALAALELFEVGTLVTEESMLPGMCYGPCPDDDARIAAYLAQADRLHALRDIAQHPDASYVCYADPMTVVEDSLQAIADLEVITVGAMIEVEPETQPHCYNLPCAEDLEAAEQANDERATQIWQIAERAGSL